VCGFRCGALLLRILPCTPAHAEHDADNDSEPAKRDQHDQDEEPITSSSRAAGKRPVNPSTKQPSSQATTITSTKDHTKHPSQTHSNVYWQQITNNIAPVPHAHRNEVKLYLSLPYIPDPDEKDILKGGSRIRHCFRSSSALRVDSL
jgi:hypothetical protein